jgi:hypothetical protein
VNEGWSCSDYIDDRKWKYDHVHSLLDLFVCTLSTLSTGILYRVSGSHHFVVLEIVENVSLSLEEVSRGLDCDRLQEKNRVPACSGDDSTRHAT